MRFVEQINTIEVTYSEYLEGQYTWLDYKLQNQYSGPVFKIYSFCVEQCTNHDFLTATHIEHT